MNIRLLFSAALAASVLSGCNFVRFDGKALSDLGLSFDSMAAESVVTASSDYVTKSFNVADFDGITSNAPCEVVYTMGATSVTVEAPDNVIENIMVYTEDRTLNIQFDKVRIRNLKHIKVMVSSRTLQRLNANGTLEFSAPDGIGAEDFEAKVNGVADIDIDGLVARTVKVGVNGTADAVIHGLECDSVTVQINGAGDCEISGRAGYGDFTVNGAGSIDIRRLNLDKIDSVIRGAGSISRK